MNDKTVKIFFSDLKKKSITDYTRKLLDEGYSPDTRLEVWRKRKTQPDLISTNIGETAKYYVSESKIRGPELKPWVSFNLKGHF